MKTSNEKKENLLATQKASIKKVNKAIEMILSKYSKSWFGNEGDVDQELMSDFDSELYSSLFDARDNLQNIQTQTINL